MRQTGPKSSGVGPLQILYPRRGPPFLAKSPGALPPFHFPFTIDCIRGGDA